MFPIFNELTTNFIKYFHLNFIKNHRFYFDLNIILDSNSHYLIVNLIIFKINFQIDFFFIPNFIILSYLNFLLIFYSDSISRQIIFRFHHH
jgi:hypothetical protein